MDGFGSFGWTCGTGGNSNRIPSITPIAPNALSKNCKFRENILWENTPNSWLNYFKRHTHKIKLTRLQPKRLFMKNISKNYEFSQKWIFKCKLLIRILNFKTDYTLPQRTWDTPTRDTLLLIRWKLRERHVLLWILASWNYLKWPKFHGINSILLISLKSKVSLVRRGGLYIHWYFKANQSWLWDGIFSWDEKSHTKRPLKVNHVKIKAKSIIWIYRLPMLNFLNIN